jgi:hypothetical protein
MPFSPTTKDSSALSSDEAPLTYRVFEPPSGFVLTAIARNKLLICICAVALAVVGAAYAYSRPKTFSAAATVQVGQVNPNSPGFYSYVESAAALAGAFSRAISAEPVLDTIQQKLKISRADANARLSAESIPLSPVFRVFAEGHTEAEAMQLANVAANAIVAYESETNSANPEASSLLSEYSRASLAVEHAVGKLTELETSLHGHRSSPTATALVSDKAAVSTAEAKLKAIDAAYTAAVTSQAPRTGLLSLLAGATSASNARNSKIEEFGFVGLLAGIIIGCALAVARQQRRRRRLLAQVEGQVEEPAQV